MDDKSYTVRVPKRWVRIAMIVGVTALIVAPLTAVASHVFDDVPNDNTFHNDITAIADAEVTKGCNPPANDEYCPNDNVTRGQMAAFMNRLGALGPGKTPVVNAATANEADHATTANDADRAAGLDQVTYATNSELLDSPGQDTDGVSLTANCPADHLAVGGSYALPINNGRFNTTRSEPVDDGEAWQVTWYNTVASNFGGTFTVTAVCVQADSADNVSG